MLVLAQTSSNTDWTQTITILVSIGGFMLTAIGVALYMTSRFSDRIRDGFKEEKKDRQRLEDELKGVHKELAAKYEFSPKAEEADERQSAADLFDESTPQQ